MSEQIDLYYLQCVTKGYLGNSPLFWAKGGSGYTQWIDYAEKFTEKDARDIIHSSRGSHQWSMWPASDIESVAKRTVDMQDLRKAEV